MAHAATIALRSLGALAAALSLAAAPALAQDAPAQAPAKPAAAPAKPAAAPAKDAGQANKSAWVKLCEKTPLMKKGEDGKEVKEEKDICLTHHERLDGNSGMVLVSAAIREVEGQDKKHLMIMVPLGMALPPGLRTAVYTKDQWAKVAKNEKIDDKELKPVDLKYSLCHASGCTAEVEADAALLDQLKAGGGIMVVAVNAGAQPVGFPVPLDGFSDAFAGKPVDNAEYKKARGQLMAQIRERQKAALEKFKAEQLKKIPTDAPGAPPTTTGSAPAKPAAPAKQ
jgi:invasion protein IalB